MHDSRHHRYETFWLNFMADELALCPETLVVAHGTAADALLRFAENREASPWLQVVRPCLQPRELLKMSGWPWGLKKTRGLGAKGWFFDGFP